MLAHELVTARVPPSGAQPRFWHHALR
jgi:hypothetical protein